MTIRSLAFQNPRKLYETTDHNVTVGKKQIIIVGTGTS
jgi:hypothetical protein